MTILTNLCNKKPSLLKPSVAIALIITIISSPVYIIYSSKQVRANREQDTAIQVESSEVVEQVKAIDYDEMLKTRLTTLLNTSTLDIGISIVDTATNISYDYGDNSAYVAASITKLLTAVAFLQKVEQGSTGLGDYISYDTATSLLTSMIVVSDNDAWYTLDEYLGSPVLTKLAISLGMTSYDASLNTLSAHDAGTLLKKLYNKELLSEEYTNLLLGLMKNASETQYMVAALAGKATIYHKVGYLEDRLHEVAIIDTGVRVFIISVFSKDTSGSYDFSSSEQLFGQIALEVYDAFMTS